MADKNLYNGEMGSSLVGLSGRYVLGDRKGLHRLTMPGVEIRVVDGVLVGGDNRGLYRIVDNQGDHRNNLPHIHGCVHGLRYSGGHHGTTLCFERGGGSNIVLFVAESRDPQVAINSVQDIWY